MASKISKERTISSVILVIIALATILPGGPILAVTLYLISNVAFLELTKACGIHTGKKLNALEITGMLADKNIHSNVDLSIVQNLFF